MDATQFWIYDYVWIYFAVVTLSQEFIYARTAEINRAGIFSKLLVDRDVIIYQNHKKYFFEKIWVTSFCFFRVDKVKLYIVVSMLLETEVSDSELVT